MREKHRMQFYEKLYLHHFWCLYFLMLSFFGERERGRDLLLALSYDRVQRRSCTLTLAFSNSSISLTKERYKSISITCKCMGQLRWPLTNIRWPLTNIYRKQAQKVSCEDTLKDVPSLVITIRHLHQHSVSNLMNLKILYDNNYKLRFKG